MVASDIMLSFAVMRPDARYCSVGYFYFDVLSVAINENLNRVPHASLQYTKRYLVCENSREISLQ